MIATAASAATHGWQTATYIRAWPYDGEKIDDVLDVLVETEAPRGEPRVASVVPVRDSKQGAATSLAATRSSGPFIGRTHLPACVHRQA